MEIAHGSNRNNKIQFRLFVLKHRTAYCIFGHICCQNERYENLDVVFSDHGLPLFPFKLLYQTEKDWMR